ncbi:MAG: alpha/beta fold hydrolase [Methanospirillum sp.]|nr:alpha/beta fold hydrolase [Methanospirillum sp.]
MTTFVLMHGTGAGGWCWQRVAQRLRAGGFEVHAPTLTGVGDRSHLAGCGVDLETHVREIAGLLFYEDIADAVLVGHSYGGMVVTGVAARVPERLRLVVYLDAYVPEAGESEYDLWTPEMQAEFQAALEGGGMRPPPAPALVGIADPALAAWYAARVTPHPPGTFTQPVPPGTPAGEAVPRAYIRCTEGPLVPLFGPSAERARRRGWEILTLAAGHEAELVAPLEVARLLAGLARRRG